MRRSLKIVYLRYVAWQLGANHPDLLPVIRMLTCRQKSEQRALSAVHWVGGKPIPQPVTWWPFDPPTHARTPYVIFASLFGMTAVLITALATAPTHPEGLLLIPAYGVFLMVILGLRHRQLYKFYL